MFAVRLKSFDIDLRSYSGEEYERRYRLLDGLSWIMSEYADNPGVFRVSVDMDFMDLPLTDAFDVPEGFIRESGSNI